MIQFSNVTLMRGPKILFNDANARIYPQHKVGLIGANGAGKSSLFALLQGKLQTDQGDMSYPTDWQLASVAQETPTVNRSAIEYVLDGDTHFRALQNQLQQAEQQADGEKIAVLHGQLQDAGAYDIEARAASILHGLSFAPEQVHQPVSSFSGGWRMRLNLAQALICRSDLLLLDEPTNHLDLDAVIWLEKWLQRYDGTLILISHDKEFLDNCVGQILSIEQNQLIAYTGGYSAYETQRAERLRLQQINYEKQQDKIAHLQSFVDRFGAKASKAKQAQSRVKQIEKMQLLMPAHQDSQFSFEFPPPPKMPNPLVSMEQVQVGYDDKVILQKLQLNLVPGSRIGLLGRNGAGKSTLIKLLAGEKSPMQGTYTTSSGLQIGYFAQHQLEYLQGEQSALDHLVRLDKKATEQSLRNFLGGFGFIGDAALDPVAPMSGGEKARLVLALLVYQKPNLLLLDEPTNHLDLDMRHALNLALQGFEGAMVLVSHDRFLLSSVCDDFYLVSDGQVQPFKGDLDDYRQFLFQQSDKTSAKSDSPVKPALDRKLVKRLEAEFRQATRTLRSDIDKHEKLMSQFQDELNQIETLLADTSLYEPEQKQKLTELLQQQTKAKQGMEQSELHWLDLQETLEQKQQEFEHELASQ
ncbi:ATP-binding cassette domain-containing protein [Neptunicella marina]|uniref:Probable ATP-binding protein YheS n=1 Tax=Neptunicella marina TaxID=2125989 RepID=A0A8J6IUC2_9ALTE|nr:ATP-binding cassette domain-containing protein [Neptunicella marina]MBC3765942.1 ATP-binding cassette domain-containing protein [Neptunicella marina]